jgi:methionyl-tRNA formyltransferase
MNDIKIILLCSTRFALPALKELAFYKLLAAVAIPAQYDEMIENVEMILNGTNIPVLKLDKKTMAGRVKEIIEKNGINMGLMMTFPYKIPASVYTLPEKGFYNVHPGPLPQYRGADPVFQQLINKEKQAGVTIQKLDDGFDTGPLVMNEMLKIDPADTHGMLTTKLAKLASKLIATLIKLAGLGVGISSRPQDETKARYFKLQVAADILINWQTMDADSIIALIHACNPWNKGAVARINQQVIRFLDAEKLIGDDFLNKVPGTILSMEESGVTVSTLQNEAIRVRIIYAEEGYLPAQYLRRLGIAVNNRFDAIA